MMKKQTNYESAKKQQRKFLSFLNAQTESLICSEKLSLAQNYRSSGRSLERYLNTLHKKDISLRNVDAKLMASYQQWMYGNGVRKNTMVFYMRNLHAVYNKAVRQQLVADRHPFSSVQTCIRHTDKRAVTPDLIRNISTIDIPSGLILLGQNPNKKPFGRMCRHMAFARDMFIFCFCARGLTFVDLAFLKRENICYGHIIYERRKTGQHIEVEILPLMQDFINKYATADGPYLFPILTVTDAKKAYQQYRSDIRRYNNQLARLSKMLGSDVRLTSYVSRHSWATAAYHADVPLPYISEAMGHTSEHTTRIYLKSLESSKIDKENKRLLDNIFRN